MYLKEGAVRQQLAQRGLMLMRHARGYTVKALDHRVLDTVETTDLEDAHFQGVKLGARLAGKAPRSRGEFQ